MIATRERTPVRVGEAVLEFDRVSKAYGPVMALNDVSMRLEPREFVVLLGPSGSGKSTLLRCAAGIERIASGAIRLDGELIDNGSRQLPPERRDLGMVFQDYALWPHMTAHQNVAFALRRRRLASSEADRRSREMLERVGLGRLGERYPSELSGGEQQRVSLARAMVATPRLLLFDEPLSNLDANLRDRMRVEIAVLAREAESTALYITHDQGEAFALADRIGVLERGRLVQVGTPEDIYSAPATPFVARLTGLAGEVTAHLRTPTSPGLTTIWIGGKEIMARAIDLVDAGSVVVHLRPTALRLSAPADQANALAAEVRDVAFSARGYEHVVRLGTGELLTGILAVERWERGEPVAVRLDPRGCLVFANRELR